MTNSKYLIGGGVLEDICDAVREIEGSSSKILVSDLPGRVAGLEQKIEMNSLPPVSRKMLNLSYWQAPTKVSNHDGTKPSLLRFVMFFYNRESTNKTITLSATECGTVRDFFTGQV